MADQRSYRLDSIDLLRGLVMAIMALDHTRDFFQTPLPDPMDAAQTWPALFFIRWITHFCAPTFVFLAGVSGHLMRVRKPIPELRHFLWTRGLWLIFLELTFIRCFGWFFNFNYLFSVGQVIWAIGWSMIVLSWLLRFSTRWVGLAGVLIIALHNLTDPIKAEQFGPFWWLWRVLHDRKPMEIWPGHFFFPQYPLLPWIGIMLAGYGFGEVFPWGEQTRRRAVLRTGLALVTGFVVIRWLNVYGDPRPYQQFPEAMRTLFSFLNCMKYPPSLLYVLMTLGPALVLLSQLPDTAPRWLKPLVTLGRVPMFFYLMHVPLLHGTGVLFALATGFDADWMWGRPGDHPVPKEFGLGILGVYLVWLAAMAIMFPFCAWFAEKKRQSGSKLLSYL